MSEEKIRYYVIRAICTNCDWQGDRKVPKGITIEDMLGPGHLCPCCECETLKEKHHIVSYDI